MGKREAEEGGETVYEARTFSFDGSFGYGSDAGGDGYAGIRQDYEDYIDGEPCRPQAARTATYRIMWCLHDVDGSDEPGRPPATRAAAVVV